MTGAADQFYPAENNIPVTIREDGSVQTDRNVVEIRANAPTGGFEVGGTVDDPVHVEGPATGDVFIEVLDPRLLQDGVEYTVDFVGSNLRAGTFEVRG